MGVLLPAKSLEQVFSFEGNIEGGFLGILTEAGFDAFSSRQSREFKTPSVCLWFQNGDAVKESQHAIAPGIPGRFLPFATYTGVLSTEIVTNRVTPNQHTEMIALVRLSLQMFRLYTQWNKFEAVSLIVDIREGGTIDTWEDENSLDHTTITWNILHSINKGAWPSIDIDNPR